MNAIGMIRNIGAAGRVVIPKKMRSIMGIHGKATMVIRLANDAVMLRKYEEGIKHEGIIYDMDEKGRIAIPVEMRRALRMRVGLSVMMRMKNGQISIRACQSGCVCCGETEIFVRYRGIKICRTCCEDFLREINKAAK